jgi:hypothetical protein
LLNSGGAADRQSEHHARSKRGSDPEHDQKRTITDAVAASHVDNIAIAQFPRQLATSLDERKAQEQETCKGKQPQRGWMKRSNAAGDNPQRVERRKNEDIEHWILLECQRVGKGYRGVRKDHVDRAGRRRQCYAHSEKQGCKANPER